MEKNNVWLGNRNISLELPIPKI